MIWFWVLLVVASIAIAFFVEHERGVYSGITLVAAAGAAFWLQRYNPWPWFQGHAVWVLGFVLLYFVAGTVWAIVKWWSYVAGKRRILDQRLAEQTRRSGTTLDHFTPSDWAYVEDAGISREPPQAAHHVDRILSWMTYWPWSAAWTLLDDPVRRLFYRCYDLVAGLMQRIANRAWRGIPGKPARGKP